MKPRERCGRCVEWERMGLSAYCPACDAEFYADTEYEALQRAVASLMSEPDSHSETENKEGA